MIARLDAETFAPHNDELDLMRFRIDYCGWNLVSLPPGPESKILRHAKVPSGGESTPMWRVARVGSRDLWAVRCREDGVYTAMDPERVEPPPFSGFMLPELARSPLFIKVEWNTPAVVRVRVEGGHRYCYFLTMFAHSPVCYVTIAGRNPGYMAVTDYSETWPHSFEVSTSTPELPADGATLRRRDIAFTMDRTHSSLDDKQLELLHWSEIIGHRIPYGLAEDIHDDLLGEHDPRWSQELDQRLINPAEVMGVQLTFPAGLSADPVNGNGSWGVTASPRIASSTGLMNLVSAGMEWGLRSCHWDPDDIGPPHQGRLEIGKPARNALGRRSPDWQHQDDAVLHLAYERTGDPYLRRIIESLVRCDLTDVRYPNGWLDESARGEGRHMRSVLEACRVLGLELPVELFQRAALIKAKQEDFCAANGFSDGVIRPYGYKPREHPRIAPYEHAQLVHALRLLRERVGDRAGKPAADLDLSYDFGYLVESFVWQRADGVWRAPYSCTVPSGGASPTADQLGQALRLQNSQDPTLPTRGQLAMEEGGNWLPWCIPGLHYGLTERGRGALAWLADNPPRNVLDACFWVKR